MKRLSIVLFVMLFSAAVIPLKAQNRYLDSLVARSIEVSPKIKMLEAKMKSASYKLPQVSNLPDPTLTLGLANMPTNSFSFTQEPMTGKTAGLSQAFPFPGKLSEAGKVSGKDVEIIKEEIRDLKNEIKKDITGAYYDLCFIRKSISITLENKNLLQNIAQVVRTKYSVSTASQQNLLKVELEITNINDKLDELMGKEKSQTAIINSYLLNKEGTEIKTTELPEINYLDLTVSRLDSLSVSNRPYLAGTKLAINKAKLQESLAKYDYYPNFNLSLQYSQRDRISATNTPLNDLFSVIIGITLPLNYGGKVTSKIEEAESMQEFYRQQYKLALQSLNENFGKSIAKLNSLKKRIRLIKEGLLPQANQTLTSTLASYQVGQVDFINVIDSQRDLYQIEINQYKLKTDYLKEIAQLEFLTGTNFNMNQEIKR